jgi:hypothetical protein
MPEAKGGVNSQDASESDAETNNGTKTKIVSFNEIIPYRFKFINRNSSFTIHKESILTHQLILIQQLIKRIV